MARVKPGDITNAVSDLYSYGRSDGRSPPKPVGGASKAHDITPAYEPPDPAQQAVQDPEAKHAAGYDNDAKGWVRGMGQQSPHPHFDSGASGNRFK